MSSVVSRGDGLALVAAWKHNLKITVTRVLALAVSYWPRVLGRKGLDAEISWSQLPWFVTSSHISPPLSRLLLSNGRIRPWTYICAAFFLVGGLLQGFGCCFGSWLLSVECHLKTGCFLILFLGVTGREEAIRVSTPPHPTYPFLSHPFYRKIVCATSIWW